MKLYGFKDWNYGLRHSSQITLEEGSVKSISSIPVGFRTATQQVAITIYSSEPIRAVATIWQEEKENGEAAVLVVEKFL